jgi:cyanate permease
MQKTEFRVYPYRWIILSIYMLMVAVNQLLWITFAPITADATHYFAVSDLKIGMLSMCFMIVYLVVSIPASWIIDTYGIRIGVGTGVLFTGVFGFLRGLAPANYELVLLSQVGIAIGQPFILNAITKVAARWFPIEERATASGLGTLAMYVGILIGMILTPYMVIGSGINGMLHMYGIFSLIAAAIFIALAKERPLTAPCRPDQEERALAIDGLKLIFRCKDFNWLMLIFFIGLGIFNAVTTWIENIIHPRGFSAVQAGTTGGIMIIGGVLGALIIPILSDYYRKRTIFIIIALAGATISLIGLIFASSYPMLLASGMAFGFFLLSSGPVGFQYGAEITYPVSEGTSNGFLLLMGQISGIAFIFGMDFFKSPVTGSMTRPMIVLIGLMVLGVFISTRLRESTLLGLKDEKLNIDKSNPLNKI